MATFKVGRDATSGRFIPVIVALERPATAVVETIEVASMSVRRVQQQSAARTLTTKATKRKR